MGCVYNIIIQYVYTYLSKHKYNKKICCIKIVPTGNTTIKKSNIIYVETNKISKN